MKYVSTYQNKIYFQLYVTNNLSYIVRLIFYVNSERRKLLRKSLRCKLESVSDVASLSQIGAFVTSIV